jgi:hypothetical protein
MRATLIGLAAAGCAILGMAACGSTTTTTTTTTSTPTPVVANGCPMQYKGQRVDLSGTIIVATPLSGRTRGPTVSEVRGGNGEICELVTADYPGAMGATITVRGYVAYVSTFTPPNSWIAFPAYAACDVPGGDETCLLTVLK